MRGRPEIRGDILGEYTICEKCFNKIEGDDKYTEKNVPTCHPVTTYRVVKICMKCTYQMKINQEEISRHDY